MLEVINLQIEHMNLLNAESRMSKYISGGSYKEGAEVMMSEAEMRKYIQDGGEVEIIEETSERKY